MPGKGGEGAVGINPDAMPGMPAPTGMGSMGIDPQLMRQMMAMQFLGNAATSLGNISAFQRDPSRPQRTAPSNPMAAMIPMLQMQQMGLVGQKRAEDLAKEKAQSAAYYGAQDVRAGGPGTWVNPDTNQPQYEGMISQAPAALRPLLGSMDADKGTGTLATIVAQQLKPKELPTSAKEFDYYSKLTPEQQQAFDVFRKNGNSALPAAAIQNDAHRAELVEQFGENSPRVKQFDVYVRALQSLNLGDRIELVNPANVGAGPVLSSTINVSPNEDPALKGDQEFAKAIKKAEAEMQNDSQKKALQAFKTLDTLDGVDSLIDKSTGSFGGAALDALSAAFGHATEGAINASKLKVVQAGLMLNMPRMEGPQSDRDVQLYREAAASIGDPTVPNAAKKAAVEQIREVQKRYIKSAPALPGPKATGDGWSMVPVK